MSVNNKPFLNVTETAALLGVHPNTVRNWVAAGTLVSARVPGAKQHRFAREEVMRLVEQRGNPASSIAPQFRTDEPELVSATRLAEWAAHDDAKVAFPELMRQLLALTPGITNIDIRAHEGVAAPGWDGSATSTGSAYLPAGELRFEFGTAKDSRGKAQSDYEKRVLGSSSEKGTVFVYATPRSWAGGRSWAAERTAEHAFAAVKVIDAHVLEGWLRETPAVHYWISERLGFSPRDAQTLGKWWESFQGRVKHAIPASFFAAGRTSEAGLLLAGLKGGGAGEAVMTVKAAWRDEALAFVYAVVESDPALANRTLVVTEGSAWNRLVVARRPMILIPMFEGADLKAAEEAGHRLILVAGREDSVRRGNVIELPKIDRDEAAAALKELGLDSGTVASIVTLARRSTPAMFRSIARDPRGTPEWAQEDRVSSVLAPLVLAGSWEGSTGDREILTSLTGVGADEIERLLKMLARRADAPFVASGGLWRLASPEEAAFLLLRELEPETLDRWARVVPIALLAEDPLEGLNALERLKTGGQGAAVEYSGTLRENLARGLALAAATAADLPRRLSIQGRVDSIVRQLLHSASADSTGATWARLAKHLPALAEASPEEVQDAIESDLAGSRPILKTLFRDTDGGDGFFGPSSPHPSLIWALETLCWSPEHFGRAAMLLAKVAAIDPGGRLANRPLASLANVTAGWIAQSGATIHDKVRLVGRVLVVVPDVGWSLLLELWPSQHQVAFSPSRPAFRDWMPPTRPVTYADWGYFVHELVRLAVDAAQDRAERWAQLVPRLDDVPANERVPIVEALQRDIDGSEWSPDERYHVWAALDAEIAHHEAHPNASWSLPTGELSVLKDLARRLEPSRDPRRFSSLFGWNAPVPGLRLGEPGYDEALAELQTRAITDVLGRGLGDLEVLVADVRLPQALGLRLAEMSDVPESGVVAWLEADELNLRAAALAYARRRLLDVGFGWLESLLDASPQLADQAREALMTSVPFAKEYWTQVDDLGHALQGAYWRAASFYDVPEPERPEAVEVLLQHDRPWQAVALLALMIDRKQSPEVLVVKRALRAVLESRGPVDERQMSGYHVQDLLEYLEESVPNDADLPHLEFLFFRLLPDHQPSGALYRALGADPGEFVELIKVVFRREGETSRKLSELERARAGLGWSVLHQWSTLPGLRPDGTIDGDHLAGWVRSARLSLADAGRASIGDEQIGQVLASSPVGADGVWPAEEVRDIIETLLNTRIETGLHIGRTNQRGVTSRGVYDGGDQERELEKEYRQMASRIATRWPRTARVLRDIADNYQREAAFHDADAERLADQG